MARRKAVIWSKERGKMPRKLLRFAADISGDKVMRYESKCEATVALSQSTPEERVFLENVPVFINVRDRLSCLKQLLNWLDRAGHRNITLIDNASTYPPLLRFLDQTHYRTIRLRRNLGNTALWRVKELRSIIAKQWFVYTDPDVVPADSCPLNVVAHLHRLLQQFPFYLKAGLGLRLDDIPDCYHLKRQVINWEQQLIGKEISRDVLEADVDTTFALYRPGTPFITGPSIRLQGKYSARHLPWYTDSSRPDNEEHYYRSHASPGVTTWNVYGDARYQAEIGPGGIAALIDSDPRVFLNTILKSKIGRIASLLSCLRSLPSAPQQRWEIESMTPGETKRAIVTIITSDSWNLAWRLTDPLRRFKYRCLTFAKTIIR